MTVDLGSVPDWLAGVAGTVVAGGLFWEVRQRRLADERAENERRDGEAATARLVAFETYPTERRCIVKVVNNADAPIRLIEFFLRLGDEIRRPTAVGHPDSFMAGHDRETFDFLYDGWDRDALDDLVGGMEFTDSNGLRWSLEEGAQPIRLTSVEGAISPSRRPLWPLVAIALGAVGAVSGVVAVLLGLS